MIVFLDDKQDLYPAQLDRFFADWEVPLSATQLVEILQNSYAVELAYDYETVRVIGLANALSDQIQFAFIPLFEVLPTYLPTYRH